MVPKDEKTRIRKMIRTMVGSHLRYSPIPPHTPAIILFMRDFLSFAGIKLSFSQLCVIVYYKTCYEKKCTGLH